MAKPAQQKQGISINTPLKVINSEESLVTLGATLTHNLKWNATISPLMSQLHQRLAVLRLLAKYATRGTLRNIASSTILSKIHYNISLVGALPDYLAQKVQSVMIQAAKVVLGSSSFRQSTSTLFTRLNWLSYRQSEHYFTAKIALRALRTGTPQALASMIPPVGTQVTRAQQQGQLPLPHWTLSASLQSYRRRSIIILNNLPQ